MAEVHETIEYVPVEGEEEKPKKAPAKRTTTKKITKAEQNRRAKAAKAKAAENKSFREAVEAMPNMYKCTSCGKVTNIGPGNFFVVNYNPTLAGNDNRTYLCNSCVDKMMREYTDKYGDKKIACLIMCMYLGAFFSEEVYEKMHDKEVADPENEFTMGVYLRNLNVPAFKKQNFLSYLISLLKNTTGMKPVKEMREKLEDGWKAADRRNKMMCIKEIGYDCFEDEQYSSYDRKLMFASLAQYLNNADITEDKHRRDAAISIVKTNMQIEFLDRALNKESRSIHADFSLIERMIAAKKQLSAVVNSIAKENAISTSGAGRRQTSSLALTSIMKEMVDAGVMEAKTNLTSVKMTQAFSNIAKISSRALINEMAITGDEYAAMAAKQAETIRLQAKTIDELEEKLRLALIAVQDLKSDGKKYVVHTVAFDEDGLALVDIDPEGGDGEGDGEPEIDFDASAVPDYVVKMDIVEAERKEAVEKEHADKVIAGMKEAEERRLEKRRELMEADAKERKKMAAMTPEEKKAYVLKVQKAEEKQRYRERQREKKRLAMAELGKAKEGSVGG